MEYSGLAMEYSGLADEVECPVHYTVFGQTKSKAFKKNVDCTC